MIREYHFDVTPGKGWKLTEIHDDGKRESYFWDEVELRGQWECVLTATGGFLRAKEVQVKDGVLTASL